MLVSELMNKNVVTISPDEPASLAARLLFRHNIGSVPVCSKDGRLRGIVTDRDIALRCVAADNDPETTPVREIMSRCVISVAPDDDITAASVKMSQGQVRRLPVVKDGQLVGLISLGDMATCRQCDMEAGHALSEISANIRRV